ncbi:hypothetical protein C6500_15290 [Candidatus Poribacteria bacterium]|nr:MAG: hypothetical protein C6500_15290 [Candidatus Poribacteria bacterium]
MGIKHIIKISVLTFFAVSVAVGAVEIEDVTFGFGDGYRIGTWAPLTVTVRNQDEGTVFSGELVVEVRNFSSDVPIERYATPLHLIGIGTQRKDLYVYCPKNATQLVIRLVPITLPEVEGGRRTATELVEDILLPTPLARKDYFMLVLAPSGDKLKRFVDKKQLAVSGGTQVHVKYLPNPTSLPRAWIGYNAVDVLVVRETRLTERRVLKSQQTAMLDWIQRGGTLIISGGSSFNYLRGSFIEPFLPVELKGVGKTNILPVALFEQLNGVAISSRQSVVSSQQKGTTSLENLLTESRQPMADSHFEYIQFAPRAGCEVLVGTAEQIYVAKRDFGDGQIICLAFDYNAPPFDVSQKNSVRGVSGEIRGGNTQAKTPSNGETPKQKHPDASHAETFWHGLLSKHGKSPRHLADRYALALQHEEEIHKHFLSEMPTRVPLIKLLAIVLPIYLLGFGGFLLYFGKSRQKSRTYWIGGCLFVLLSVSIIASARRVWFPNTVTADRLSILSVYPERQRAHLLSYVSLRAASRAETSIDFTERTFVRHQEVEKSKGELLQKIGTLVQSSHVQLRDVSVEPWHPTTYVEEKFLALDRRDEVTSPLPQTLEHTWHIAGKEMTYLGNVALRNATALEASEPSMTRLRLQVTPKMPPDEELDGVRKTFAQILRRDYVLRYLATEANLNPAPYLIGWISQGITGAIADGKEDKNETLVIFRPDAGR